MRLRGDPDGCRAAARQLARAAAEVGRAAEELRPEPLAWTGTASVGWSALTSRHGWALRAQAERLAAAAHAVGQFADDLEQLQDQARRLTRQAEVGGLDLDDDGWIRRPRPDPLRHEEVVEREELRRRLMTSAARLRSEEDEAHARLAGRLRSLRQGPDGSASGTGAGPSVWRPTAADGPPVALSAAHVAARLRDAAPSVLRSAAATTGLGFGYGVGVDLQQGRDLDDALTKNVAVTATSLAAAAGAAAGVAAAPVAVPAAAAGAAVVTAGAGVAYVAGRAFDRWGHQLPWVERPGGRPRRRATRAAGAPTATPRPAPGPRPAPVSTEQASSTG